MKKLSLKPPDRTVALQALWDQQGPADLGPCGEWKREHGSGLCVWPLMVVLALAGGFSHQYWCVCDSLGLPYREEVQWVSTFHPLRTQLLWSSSGPSLCASAAS